MNWFLDNPVGNLKGPLFLVYYGAYCLAVTLIHWVGIKLSIEESYNRNKCRGILALAMICIVLTGAYKLTVALMKGYTNVLFLILMCTGFSVLQWVIMLKQDAL